MANLPSYPQISIKSWINGVTKLNHINMTAGINANLSALHNVVNSIIDALGGPGADVDSNYMSLTKGGVVDLEEDPATANTHYFGAKHGTKSFHQISDNSYAYRVSDGDGNLVQHNANKNGVVSWLKTANGVSTITKVPFKSTTGTHDLAFQEDLDATNAKIAKQESDIQYLYRQVIGGGDLVTETDSGVSLTSQNFPLTVSPKALLDYVGGMCQKVNQLLPTSVLASTSSQLGVTKTNNGDGSFTMSGTADGGTAYLYFLSTTRTLIQSHKYCVFALGNFNKIANMRIRAKTEPDGANSYFNPNTIVTGYVSFDQIFFSVPDGETASGTVTLTLVDISDAYPTDTPTSTSDPRIQWLMSYLSSHPEYDAGSILTAPVTKVVSIGQGDKTALSVGKKFRYVYIDLEALARASVSDNYYFNIGGFKSDDWADGRFIYQRANNRVIIYKPYGNNANVIYANSTGYYDIGSTCELTSMANNDGTYVQDATKIIEYPVPAEVRALDGYGWGFNADCNNYASYERKKFVKMVARVDLGTLDWEYNANGVFRSLSDPSMGMVVNPQNALCDKYAFNGSANDSTISVIASNLSDKQICGYSNAPNANRLVVKDSSAGTDATAFKQAMQGVYLYYPLATTVETDISEYIDSDVIVVSAGGHLEFENEDDLGVPYSATYQYKDADPRRSAISDADIDSLFN